MSSAKSTKSLKCNGLTCDSEVLQGGGGKFGETFGAEMLKILFVRCTNFLDRHGKTP
jgi:hypothetical protein